jgi:hypothetical protein
LKVLMAVTLAVILSGYHILFPDIWNNGISSKVAYNLKVDQIGS